MQECEKIVRRMDFMKAIEVGDPPSAAEGLDLNSMGAYAPDGDGDMGANSIQLLSLTTTVRSWAMR